LSKEKHTTYTIGPVSRLRLREALRDELGRKPYDRCLNEWWTDGFHKSVWRGIHGTQFYWEEEKDKRYDETTEPEIGINDVTGTTWSPTRMNSLHMTNVNPSTGNRSVFAITSVMPFRYGILTFRLALPSDINTPWAYFGWQSWAFTSGLALFFTQTPTHKLQLIMSKTYSPSGGVITIDLLTGASYNEMFGEVNDFQIVWQPNRVEVYHEIARGLVKPWTRIGEFQYVDYGEHIPEVAMPLFFEMNSGPEYTYRLAMINCSEGVVGY